MDERPAPAGVSEAAFELQVQRLGPLFLLNHFVARLGLDGLLERHVPATDPRRTLSHSRALGVLLRSILVEREPVYRHHELVQSFASGAFGLSDEESEHLSDDT